MVRSSDSNVKDGAQLSQATGKLPVVVVFTNLIDKPTMGDKVHSGVTTKAGSPMVYVYVSVGLEVNDSRYSIKLGVWIV